MASLVNLVIYSEAPDAIAANTPLHMPSPEAVAKTARILAPPTVTDRKGSEASLGNWNGQREWSALLRQLAEGGYLETTQRRIVLLRKLPAGW